MVLVLYLWYLLHTEQRFKNLHGRQKTEWLGTHSLKPQCPGSRPQTLYLQVCDLEVTYPPTCKALTYPRTH